jgi:hypothetical protein
MAAREDTYATTSRLLLAQAKEELEKEDLRQASEKVWGAAAQMVKAAAERRGWRHDTHRRLFEIVARLSQETGDEDIRRFIQSASALHFNFYESIYPREIIERSLQDVEDLTSRLERL